MKKSALRRENRRLREAVDRLGMICCRALSATVSAMQDIFSMIKKVAIVDCNVLLQGESGTGKELVAKSIHQLSPRRESSFYFLQLRRVYRGIDQQRVVRL